MPRKTDDDKPQKLPKRFRASADPKDAAAFELLQANDAEQRERLGEAINAPFLQNTPLERERSRAYITIEAIQQAANYTPEVLEQLAECYATIGRYDMARDISQIPERKETYQKYWDAVFLDDTKWCDHDYKSKYVKETIFSVRDNRERPLLACNQCRTWNVADLDYPLTLLKEREARVMADTAGMSMSEKREYLQSHFRK